VQLSVASHSFINLCVFSHVTFLHPESNSNFDLFVNILESSTEENIFTGKYLDNRGKYETSFKHDEYEFGMSRHLTFFVYVYNVNGNCMIEVSICDLKQCRVRSSCNRLFNA